MEKKDLTIKTLANIDYAYKSSRMISIICIMGFIFAVCLIFYLYTSAVVRNTDRVYIAKDLSIERIVDKKAMVEGHVRNFYKLFFEIDQYNYKDNVNRALELIGESGKELNKAYANANYYSRLINNNLSIAVDIDSVRIENEQFPYRVNVYGKRHIRGAYGTKSMWLNSSMLVYQVSNSIKNPFGMMIEKFAITNDSDIQIKSN